jgi:hypothetical protein
MSHTPVQPRQAQSLQQSDHTLARDIFITDMSMRISYLKRKMAAEVFLQAHRETDRFFAASGVQSAHHDRGFFHLRRAAYSSMLKSKCGNILAKASALCVNLNLDGSPMSSNSHTRPSHSQTSRLLTSSLSLGVPVPRPTQCM